MPVPADVPARDRLDDLLERGEVTSALILKGDFTDAERELIQRAYEIGVQHGRTTGPLAEVARAAREVMDLDYGYRGGEPHWEALRAALERLDGPDKEQPHPSFDKSADEDWGAA